MDHHDHHDTSYDTYMGSYEQAVGDSMYMDMGMPSICYCAGETEIHGPEDVPPNCITELSQICDQHFSDIVCTSCASTFENMAVTDDCFMAVVLEMHGVCG